MNSCFRFTVASIVCITAIAFWNGWCCNAHGFQVNTTNSGEEIQWFDPNARYYINPSGGPSESLSAIRAAMETWTNVPTSEFSFTYNGETQSSNSGENDGTNILCFRPLGENGTLGLNSFWFNSYTGEMLDSDITLNTSYSWDTNGSQNAFDVQNVATHELGHALSLADLYDSGDSEKTMYFQSTPGETKQRSLHQDDINGITYLYPEDTTSSTTTSISTTTTSISSASTTTTIPSVAVASPDSVCRLFWFPLPYLLSIQSHGITFSSSCRIDYEPPLAVLHFPPLTINESYMWDLILVTSGFSRGLVSDAETITITIMCVDEEAQGTFDITSCGF